MASAPTIRVSTCKTELGNFVSDRVLGLKQRQLYYAGPSQIALNANLAVHTDFGLAQIFPLNDEDSEVEVKAVAASFADPYLLVIRDDKNFIVLESDKSGDLDEVERGEGALNGEWLAGCLYTSPHTHGKILAFLINAQGGLEVRQFGVRHR